MFITYHSLGCFKIQTKDAVIITDPYQDSVGLKLPKAKADIVTMTDPNSELCNNIDRVIGEPIVVDHPGEYESHNTFIYSVPSGGSVPGGGSVPADGSDYPSSFLMVTEDIFIAHLGLTDKLLTDKQLELFEDAHILFLPLQTLSGEKASEIVSQIEPRLIVPMYYQLPGLKIKSVPPAVFAKEMGVKDYTGETRLKISKKDLPQEETKVVFMQPS